jgi:hypothetical protein
LYEDAIRESFTKNGVLTSIVTGSTGQDSTINNFTNLVIGGTPSHPVAPYAYPASGSFDDKLEAIITQKWVALAGTKQGLESFFERNRNNNPATSAVSSPTPTSANGAWVAGTALDPAYEPGEFVYPKNGTTTGKKFATRLLFPTVERSRNPNTPAQVDFTEPVWWDVN